MPVAVTLRRHQQVSRRRTDSMRSSTSSSAPNEDLSSLFGDDVCTTCGASVRSDQLYCSQKCRAKDANYTHEATSAPNVALDHSSKLLRRYPLPPSPNLLAMYGTGHLTSPALTAHNRRRSLQQTRQAKHLENEQWTSSSSDEESGATKINAALNRRSSSQSTISSASEGPSLTDISTPSPNAHSASIDNLDDLEAVEFALPPSIQPAAAVLLNSKSSNDSKDATIKARRQARPSLPNVQASRKPNTAAMSFARRPSRTNLPPPVLFTSPIMNTKASTSIPKRSPVAQMTPLPSVSPTSKPKEVPGSQPLRKSPSSPPQVASASSSAGKTMKATSPPVGVSPKTHDVEIVCGRYGCQGISNAEPLSESRRSSLVSGHKHTHSAGAGLTLNGLDNTLSKVSSTAGKFQLTPVIPSQGLPPTDLVDDTHGVKSPPRGRSKARDSSSTSRRSTSPPRGAARRGRSEEFSVPPPKDTDADEEQDNQQRGRSRNSRVQPLAEKTTNMQTSPSVPAKSVVMANHSTTGYDEVDLDEL